MAKKKTTKRKTRRKTKRKTTGRKLTSAACGPLKTMRLPHGYTLTVRKARKTKSKKRRR